MRLALKSARKSALLLGLAASLFVPVRAADLELDATYGDGGVSALSANERLQGGSFGYVPLPVAIVILDDGSVLYAGTAPTSGSMRLLKVSPQGRLDAQFGVGGRVDLPLGAASDGSSPGVAILPNGQILVGGAAPAGTGGTALPVWARVLRLSADGTLDTRFGDGGFADRVIPGAEGPSRAVRVALDSQQRIRVVASCDPIVRDAPRRCQARSWRLLADGRFDAGFAESTIPSPETGVAYPLAIASMADDSSFVLLEEPEDLMDNFERLLRFLPDGRLDSGFANGSITRQIQAILPAERGLYVAQGVDRAGGNRVGEIIRLDALGATDLSFGVRGSLALTSSPLLDESTDFMVALAADGPGALLASGVALSDRGPRINTLLTRVTNLGSGAIDRNFGRDGFSRTSLGLSFYNGQAVRRDAAGRILVAGLSSDQVATGRPIVARLYEPGTLPGNSPGVFVLSSNSASLLEAGGPIRIQVLRSGGARGPASLDYEAVSGSATEGSDFRAVRGRLDWADGDSSERDVQVASIDDSIAEAAESFSLVFRNATGARFLVDATVRVSVQDDDPPSAGGATAGPSATSSSGSGSGSGSGGAGGGSGGGGAAGPALLAILGGAFLFRWRHRPMRVVSERGRWHASRG